MAKESENEKLNRALSLVGEFCVLTFANGFVLEGVLEEVTEHYIVFRTSKKRSILCWNIVGSIIPKDEKNKKEVGKWRV
ncbi:MAG: hypothetical protein QXS02_04795 [Candidatus Thermoplasmatota archaeon]